LLELLLSPETLARRALALCLTIAFPLSACPWPAAKNSSLQRQNSANVTKIQKLLDEVRRASLDGQFEQACQLASEAATVARQAREHWYESKALLSVSACRIRLFDYRQAQQAAETSRQIALEIHDLNTAGASTVNLATIYLQLGDYRLAGREAAYGARLLADQPNKERLVKALLIYANTEAERTRKQIENGRAPDDPATEQQNIQQLERNYRHGVDVAHLAHLPIEAKLWEELGYSLLLARHPERAEEPLHRAYMLESAAGDRDALATNEAHQAELQLQKGNYERALSLLDRAFASSSLSFRTMPRFYPLHLRGVLLEKLRRDREALAELHKAVDAANEWRQQALPGDATSTQTVVVLQDVYRDYAQLAADVSIKTKNINLARDGLEVLAQNRAANLLEESKLALSRNQRLPAHYYELLRELQSAQARVTLGENRQEDKVRLQQVRLEIGSIENKLGLKVRGGPQNGERNSSKNSLRDIQGRLSSSEVLLSFSLGRERSFLWAVTGDQVRVYRLSGEREIGAVARKYSQDVQLGRDPKAAGLKLSRELFAKLPDEIWHKSDWLLAAEGELLEGVPFSSLIDLSSSYRLNFLTKSHNIRLIPTELFLLSADKIATRRLFVGIGDPIYNTADSRSARAGQLAPVSSRAAVALGRLPGSDREIRSAARESGQRDTRLLTGARATVSSLQEAISEHPEILHFAVHVVESEGPFSQPALALSLTKDDMPELLTPEAIAALRVPGSLVILSGCSSQSGEVLPGAGLMGLSRAWLLAGAAAVVASAWPTPDDSGRFFSSFYSHLNDTTGTLGERAARALQQAQLTMQQQGDYRRAPMFWAAYSIISKE
jgi:CHAT domain-containing protein